MTTLILQTAGRVVGGALAGPFGAIIGGALGASAGHLVDQHIFSSSSQSNREGPRLSDLQIQASTEGADIPRIYGRVRINGQVIWATNYVEKINTRTEKTGGGKGGAPSRSVTQTSYSYFANFAIGLCEGEIAYIGRIWANGNLLDQEKITFRVYRGTQDQMPDSLIEAKQGSGNAPAYRGLAYIVFEELPLADYGNRLPQLSFEIVKPVGKLEKQITSMVMIPGSTEFGYDNELVTVNLEEGEDRPENKHGLEIGTDFSQSLDHLLAICPNLQRIALVVTWFGDDLRASHCAIEPRVTTQNKTLTSGENWAVEGLTRDQVKEVSRINGQAAYGGTPSDASVIRAIRAIRARGLEIVFYPFVMMDILKDNDLPSPYGAASQPPYPWRGRVTCHPAPAQPNSADKTALVDQQLTQFFTNQTWSYQRFLLHYAQLTQQAGGVDAFLIGSELRGLTWCRNASGDYPAVSHLKLLAGQVRQILGSGCQLTYGADWSEYFGHQPPEESGTVTFHLDPLWADPNIDAVGIDNYMPLGDWRETMDHKDAQQADGPTDQDYLKARIAGGEGYDWYYQSKAHREAQIRTPITDGSHGKPWVFRYKDMVNWWSNPHFNRQNGSELSTPTPWQPASKPIWFTELGCAAVHLGPNQPNLFPDEKSSENALPYASNGARDDYAQRSMLEAVLDYWQEANADKNPSSSVFNNTMLDPDQIYLWAWDARPFPSFPMRTDIWSDGENWHAGHWLNGRLGSAPLADLLVSIFADYQLEKPTVKGVDISLDGFVIDRRMSARAAMEGLMQAFGLSISSSGNQVVIKGTKQRPAVELDRQELVDLTDQPLQINSMLADYEMPTSISFAYKDVMMDFRQLVARHDLGTSYHKNEQAISLPVVANLLEMQKQAQKWMQRATHARHMIKLTLPPSQSHLEAGDSLVLKHEKASYTYQIESIEEGEKREIDAVLIPDQEIQSQKNSLRKGPQIAPAAIAQSSKPVVEILDLPLLPDKPDRPHAPYVAIHAKPWPLAMQIYEGTAQSGFSLKQTLDMPAIMGRLSQPLIGATPDHWFEAQDMEVTLLSGELASVSQNQLLAGANAAAIKAKNGQWEIIQFQKVDLIGPRRWRLRRLLRGQLGTEQAAMAGADQNARFILLDDAVQPLAIAQSRLEQVLEFRIVEQGLDIASSSTQQIRHEITGRGLKPLSPVHIRHQINPQSGDWSFSWIRRDRLNADSWVGQDIPKSEESELYHLEIWKDESPPLKMHEQTATDAKLIISAQEQTDLGLSDAQKIIFKVSQISHLVGQGFQSKESFHV